MADQQTRTPRGSTQEQGQRSMGKQEQSQGGAKSMNQKDKEHPTGKQQSAKGQQDSGCCGCG